MKRLSLIKYGGELDFFGDLAVIFIIPGFHAIIISIT